MRELNKDNFNIKTLYFEEICYGNPGNKYTYTNVSNNGKMEHTNFYESENLSETNNINTNEFNEKIYKHIKNWKRKYKPEFDICDGLIWELKIELKDGTKYKYSGHYETPETFEDFENYLLKLTKPNLINQYYKWDYSEFITLSSLQKYVNELKPLLIGKSINHIFINPDYNAGGSNIQGYDLLKDNENVDLDLIVGPSILKIGEHTLMFDMYGGSDLKISLNKEFEIINKEEIFYNEISSLFSKNVIGRKIKDITITPISEDEARGSLNWYPNQVFSDDMFEELIFELENGTKFVINIVFDNTGIHERNN